MQLQIVVALVQLAQPSPSVDNAEGHVVETLRSLLHAQDGAVDALRESTRLHTHGHQHEERLRLLQLLEQAHMAVSQLVQESHARQHGDRASKRQSLMSPMVPPSPPPGMPDALHTTPGKHMVVKHPWTEYRNQVAASHLASACGRGVLPCASWDLYEFGVFTGRSMRGLCLSLNESGVPFRRFWGFDSFVGLPAEDAATERSSVSKAQWQPGSFSSSEILRQSSYAALEAMLHRYIQDSRVGFIRGFYNESLTPQIARGMRPALFVMIDCDLYLSTLTALDWLCRHRLIVNGTLIVYNDWDPGGTGGERRAHNEVAARYGMQVESLGKSPTGQLFRVVSIWHQVEN